MAQVGGVSTSSATSPSSGEVAVSSTTSVVEVASGVTSATSVPVSGVVVAVASGEEITMIVSPSSPQPKVKRVRVRAARTRRAVCMAHSFYLAADCGWLLTSGESPNHGGTA